jgi:eukaryotic-like serine/threonine-protein kinase
MSPAVAASLKLRRVKLGGDHPDTLISMSNLAGAYLNVGRNEDALALFGEYLARQRIRGGADSVVFAGQMTQVSQDLLRARQFAAAEPYLRECLIIREKKEPQAWTTFNTKSLLGGSLLGQNKYADAEPLLTAGYAGMKQREDKIPKEGRVRVTESLERLVQLYEAIGKPVEAAKWRTELDEIRRSDATKKPE